VPPGISSVGFFFFFLSSQSRARSGGAFFSLEAEVPHFGEETYPLIFGPEAVGVKRPPALYFPARGDRNFFLPLNSPPPCFSRALLRGGLLATAPQNPYIFF